jgi:uncharacterized protein
MKIRAAIPLILACGMFSVPVFARSPQAAASQQPAASSAPQSSAAPAIDPAKAAAIRQLIDLAGGTAAMNQIMDGMQQNMKSSMSNLFPPGEYREKLIDLFFEKFRSEADPQQLLNIAAQGYDKYLTIDEIQGLIKFYSTPLGKKTLTVLPKMMVEVQGESMKWGQNLGQQAMREVLAEHPELVQAMQDAAKKNRSQ